MKLLEALTEYTEALESGVPLNQKLGGTHPRSGPQHTTVLTGLLKQFPAEEMKMVPVSTLVNSPRNEKPECVEPMDVAGGANLE